MSSMDPTKGELTKAERIAARRARLSAHRNKDHVVSSVRRSVANEVETISISKLQIGKSRDIVDEAKEVGADGCCRHFAVVA